MTITKYVLPVVVGAMSGMVLITLGETYIETFYPLPAGTDKYDVNSLSQAMATMPDNAFGMLLVNYVVGSFLGGIIATLVGGREMVRPAVVVGIVLTLAGLYNLVYLPHPGWFAAINLFIYLPFAYLGYRLVRKKKAASLQ